MWFRFFKKQSRDNEYSINSEFSGYLETMPESLIKTYIQNRVLPQINWYDKKAGESQNQFRVYSFRSMLAGVLIPVVTLILPAPDTQGVWHLIIKLSPTVLASLVVIFNFLAAQERHQSLWVSYRSNCEILKSVLHRCFTRTREFKDLEGQDLLDRLVVICEEYLTKEFETWTAANTPKSPQSSSTGS